MPRRVFLAAAAAAASLPLLQGPRAHALGRYPEGDSATMTIPWPLNRLDPHDLDDVGAALFGAAIADTLFAIDASGEPYPALVRELPRRSGSSTAIRLRPGLLTAKGIPLRAKDLQTSIERSRRRGGVALLAPITRTRITPGDDNGLLVDGLSPDELARRFASPLVSLLPRGFSPLAPDGTGPFRAVLRRGELDLERNLLAARGPALLRRLRVRSVDSLSAALRAFEVRESDLGWLGSGLYRQRRDARAIDAGSLGWVILRTGRRARDWGAPGVAQQLADHLDSNRLLHLGITAGRPLGVSTPWGGAAEVVIVDRSAPQLVKIAESAAEQLGSSGHALTVGAVSAADIARRRSSGEFALMVDFVRDPQVLSPLYALLSAGRGHLAITPPRSAPLDTRLITRTMTLGVIGELHITGAATSTLRGLESWDLGSVWRVPG